jgi:hypothetical protein
MALLRKAKRSVSFFFFICSSLFVGLLVSLPLCACVVVVCMGVCVGGSGPFTSRHVCWWAGRMKASGCFWFDLFPHGHTTHPPTHTSTSTSTLPHCFLSQLYHTSTRPTHTHKYFQVSQAAVHRPRCPLLHVWPPGLPLRARRQLHQGIID